MEIIHIDIFWRTKTYENVKLDYLSLSNSTSKNLCQGNTQESAQIFLWHKDADIRRLKKEAQLSVGLLTKSITAQGP